MVEVKRAFRGGCSTWCEAWKTWEAGVNHFRSGNGQRFAAASNPSLGNVAAGVSNQVEQNAHGSGLDFDLMAVTANAV